MQDFVAIGCLLSASIILMLAKVPEAKCVCKDCMHNVASCIKHSRICQCIDTKKQVCHVRDLRDRVSLQEHDTLRTLQHSW